jgi:glutathione S-transferase
MQGDFAVDLELVSFKLCPFVQRSVITLLHKQAPYRIRHVDLAAPPSWFLELSPAKKVPILVVDGKEVIHDSAVINEFIDEVTPGQLHPDDPLQKALNRSWIAFGTDCLMDTLHMTTTEDEAGFAEVVQDFNRKLAEVEAVFDDGPLFNGESFSLVDAAYAPIFMRARLIGHHAPVLERDRLPKVSRWAERLLSLDAVAQSVAPEFAGLYDDLIRRRQGYLSGLLPGGVAPDPAKKSRY